MQRYQIYVEIIACFYSNKEIKYLIKNYKQTIEIIIVAPTIQEISTITREKAVNLYIFFNNAYTEIVWGASINF